MTTTTGSKSNISLRDIVVSKLLTDEKGNVSYGPVKDYAPAKTATITPSSSNVPEYADDGIIDVISSNGSYTLSLGTSGVDDEVLADILGLDYEEGLTVYTKDRVSPFVAVGFKSKKADGSFGYVWMLKGKFSVPSSEFATQEDTPSPQGKTIEGTFIDRKSDGAIMATLDTAKATGAEVASFFEAVYGAPEATDTP